MAEDTNPTNLYDMAQQAGDGTLPSFNDTYAMNQDPMRAAYPQAGQVDASSVAQAAPAAAGPAVAAPPPAAAGPAQKSGAGAKGKQPTTDEILAQLQEMLKNPEKALDQASEGKGKWGIDFLDKSLGAMGISPAKGALFALGALATRNMPTGQAWQTTMKLMETMWLIMHKNTLT